MPETRVNRPFEAYCGDKPYVFVKLRASRCCLGFPNSKRDMDRGFRIWCDEEIDSGNEWLRQIEAALLGWSALLGFIASRANNSRNVRREVNFAARW